MASQLPRITILGSLNIDLVSYVSHHPLPGETMTADSFSVSPGGKGANQAVACAKLSRSRSSAGAASADENATAHVAMVGTVGADSYGSLLRDNMAAHGVDVQGVEVGKELKTGVALIVVDAPTGQNRIILSPEANHALQPAHIEGSHFGTRLGAPLPDLLIMQLEIPLATVVQALESARAAGVAVLLNPAPADANLPHSSLNGLAHLVMNETEAALLAGCDVSELDTAAGLDRVGRMFVEQRGVHNVLITLGGRGVYFTTSKGVTGQLPAEKATVVDTTAAGDTFVGQYALEVVAAKEGEFDIEIAVKKANHAAAKTVEKKGAQVSIPWRDELE